MSVVPLTQCRFCQSSQLNEVLSLGAQPLSGIFLDSRDSSSIKGLLRIKRCNECGLSQLGDSFPLNEMYGNNYGYRSGLNKSMVKHLKNIGEWLINRIAISEKDIVCDIGSNDGTFLGFFKEVKCQRIGVDPTIDKFDSFYDNEIIKIPDFFSARKIQNLSIKKITLITSIAMFYDLESPINFAKDIYNSLSENGYWFFEQSYAPWMVTNGTYDSICHEHLLYYSLRDIKNILDVAGFSIVQTYTNSVNGGSLGVLAQKNKKKGKQVLDEYSEWLLEEERLSGFHSYDQWNIFANKVKRKKESLRILIEKIHKNKKTIFGLGASTKGNIILNYSELNSSQLPLIGEVNTEKFGKFTPGSLIPIVDEKELFQKNPDYLLLLPWHFKENSKYRYREYLKNGGKIILPLPNVEIIGD